MKSHITAIALFLWSIVLAQPHRHHQHQNLHMKRGVVMYTDIEWVTTTVDITTTIWIDASSTPPAHVTPAEFQESNEPSSTPVNTAHSNHPVYIAPSPSPSSSSSSSSSTSVSSSPYVAPVLQPRSSTTSSPAPVATPSPVYVAPAGSTTAASPVDASLPPSSGYSGECSSGNPCTGDITYYDTTGYGSCGWINDGTEVPVVALSEALMGAQSNGNPYCGMNVTITYGSNQVVAMVVDKCPPCSKTSLDLSHKAFDALCQESVGRTQAKWHFN